MSEYQYYEFRAVDTPLTTRQMADLRRISTRAEITPTSFTNEYHWGDFKGNPRKMIEKYFDAFLYYANWGTHWLMLRVPQESVDFKELKQYNAGDSFTVKKKGAYVIFEYHSEDESGDCEDDEPASLASLIPLRAELLGGDLRSLYLGWLAAAQAGDLEESDVEPPVPAGLKHLPAPLQELAAFLRIDDKLLKVAAVANTGTAPAAPSRAECVRWIKAMPAAEKNGILLQLVEGDTPNLRERLVQRFRQSGANKNRAKGPKPVVMRRTVGELLASAELIGDE
jgi:hypothetical protein